MARATDYQWGQHTPEERMQQQYASAMTGPGYEAQKTATEYGQIQGGYEELKNQIMDHRKQLFRQFAAQNYDPSLETDQERQQEFLAQLKDYLDQNTDQELRNKYQAQKEIFGRHQEGLEKGVEAGAGVSMHTEVMSPEETEAMATDQPLRGMSEDAAINKLKSEGRLSGEGTMFNQFTAEDIALIKDQMKTFEAEPESFMGNMMETISRPAGAVSGALSAIPQAAREIDFQKTDTLGQIGEAVGAVAERVPEGIARGWRDPLRNPLLREAEISRDMMREQLADQVDAEIKTGKLDPEQYEERLEELIDEKALGQADLFTAYPQAMGLAADVVLDPTGIGIKAAEKLAKVGYRGARAARALGRQEQIAARAGRSLEDIPKMLDTARTRALSHEAGEVAHKLGRPRGMGPISRAVKAQKKAKGEKLRAIDLYDKPQPFIPKKGTKAKPFEKFKTKLQVSKDATMFRKFDKKRIAELEEAGHSRKEALEILKLEKSETRMAKIREVFTSSPAKPTQTRIVDPESFEGLSKFKKLVKTMGQFKKSDAAAEEMAQLYLSVQERAKAGTRQMAAKSEEWVKRGIEVNARTAEVKNTVRGMRDVAKKHGYMTEIALPKAGDMSSPAYSKYLKATFFPEVHEIMTLKLKDTGLEHIPMIMNDKLYVVERTLARYMETISKSHGVLGLKPDSKVASAIRHYKKYIRPVMLAQKMLITVGKPGFAFNEMLSNAGFFAMGNRMQALNPGKHSMALKAKFLQGFADPLKGTKYAESQLGKASKATSEYLTGVSKRWAKSKIKLKSGKKVTLGQLRQKFYTEGIGGHIGAEFKSVDDALGAPLKAKSKGREALEKVGKKASDIALAPARASSALVSAQDDYFKFQIWVNNLDDLSTKSLTKARQAVEGAFPHYGSMSVFEREVLKDGAAFYGWKRWAVKNAYKQMRDNPRLYKAWQRAIHEYKDEERKLIPVRGKAIPWYNSGAAVARLKDQPQTVQEKVQLWKKTGDPEHLRAITETEFAMDKIETPFTAQMAVVDELARLFKPRTEAERVNILDLASPAADAAFDLLGGDRYGKAFRFPSINELMDSGRRNKWAKEVRKSSTGRALEPVIQYFNRWANLIQYYAGDDKDATALAEINEHYRLTADFGLPIMLFEALSERSAPGSVLPGHRTKIVQPSTAVERVRRAGVRELKRTK